MTCTVDDIVLKHQAALQAVLTLKFTVTCSFVVTEKATSNTLP